MKKLVAALHENGEITFFESLALIAALEVSKDHWDSSLTKKYGVVATELILQDRQAGTNRSVR